MSSRIALTVSLSSTSEGWNSVYWSPGCKGAFAGTISRRVMPPIDQPWDSDTARISSSVSDKVT